MSLKDIYHSVFRGTADFPIALERSKTYIAEWIAIFQKRHLYKNILWTREQQKEFDDFWIENYGRKISNRWHKLYQRMNGIFNPAYIPEILYTTKIEPALNPFWRTSVLEDKALIELLISKKADGQVRVPDTIIVMSDGFLYDAKRDCISLATAEKTLKTLNADVVIKPTVGSSSGQGVKITNSANLAIANLSKQYGNNFIIQEKITPCEELKKLYDKAINTIRITTYIASGGGKSLSSSLETWSQQCCGR